MSTAVLQILPPVFPEHTTSLALSTSALSANLVNGNFPDLLKVVVFPITIFVTMLENMFLGGVQIATEIAIALFTIAILIQIIKWMMGEGNINSFLLEFFKKLVLMVVLIVFLDYAYKILPMFGLLFLQLGQALGASGTGVSYSAISSNMASDYTNPFLNVLLIFQDLVNLTNIAVAGTIFTPLDWLNPGDVMQFGVYTIAAVLFIIVIGLLCLYMAADFLLIQFEVLLTMCLGVIFLGFLALDATKSYGTNFIKSLVSAGFRLMGVVIVIIMANILGTYYANLISGAAQGMGATTILATFLSTVDTGLGFTGGIPVIAIKAAQGQAFIFMAGIAGVFLFGLIAFTVYMVPKILGNIISGSTGAMSAAGTMSGAAAVGGAVIGAGAAVVTGGASLAAAEGISALTSTMKEHGKDHQKMMDELNKKS